MSAIPAAFPFIEVTIDTSGLAPVAQRSPGVIAVVGAAGGGAAAANLPFQVDDAKQAADLFGTDGALTDSLRLALLQDPKPSKIYGVRINGDNYAAGLAALEAADDVTFVSLANEADVGKLTDLKNHVEAMSAGGQKRIGVGMVDPGTPKSTTYVNDVKATVNGLKSSVSRMVLLAARGARPSVATRVVKITGNRGPGGEYDAKLMKGTPSGPPPAGLTEGDSVVVEFIPERGTNRHDLGGGDLPRRGPDGADRRRGQQAGLRRPGIVARRRRHRRQRGDRRVRPAHLDRPEEDPRARDADRDPVQPLRDPRAVRGEHHLGHRPGFDSRREPALRRGPRVHHGREPALRGRRAHARRR